MISQKTLKLYVYVDGVNDVPFYGSDAGEYEAFILANGEQFITSNGFVFNVRNVNEQVEIGSFRYDAKRMGAAPTLTFTLMYEECLDNFWNDNVYAVFNNERHFLRCTPSSSKNNEDGRYKHDVELVAERKILDNTYFYDAAVGDPQENDKPVTNDTNFNFYGNIVDYAKRMNASLQHTKLQKVKEDGSIEGYYVVIDEGISTIDKKIAFSGAVFSQALQESYNTFGTPFYFVGKEIHLGFTDNVIDDVLEYGVDDALLSITKQNANFKVVNRASGKGSTDNIPYYYPNNAPKGEIEAVVNTSSDDFEVSIVDCEIFGDRVALESPITCTYGDCEIQGFSSASFGLPIESFLYENFSINKTQTFVGYLNIKGLAKGVITLHFNSSQVGSDDISSTIKWIIASHQWENETVLNNGDTYDFVINEVGEIYQIPIKLTIYPQHASKTKQWIHYDNTVTLSQNKRWQYESNYVDLKDLGLAYEGTPNAGDTITQLLIKRVNTETNLQPSIYRATDGKERFYNAVNYPFDYIEGYELQYAEYVENGKVHNDLYKKDNGEYIVFPNPYLEGNPKEHVFDVEGLMPSIKEMTNGEYWMDSDADGNQIKVFQRIDMFSEFAYDEGDNDETYISDDGKTNFKHPYFFAKLRKLDFNLFEHASESGAMTFSMTSGNCGACNFEIGVSDDESQYNTVQVYEENTTDANGVFHPKGSLVRDEEGRVLCGLEDYQPIVPMQPMQQDTINNEVWIALKKEEHTYGILMPKAPRYKINEETGEKILIEAGHRPRPCSSVTSNDGDTFVIVNINLPEEYIRHAERKLEKKIIQYIGENNTEKFNFSINFSRIFLEENPNFLQQLNENARLNIRYNEQDYLLYVSSFSYSMGEGEVLPEIRVELDDTLTISQNALQQAIDGVRSEIGQAINSLDVAAIGNRYFLRKDVDDIASGVIGFNRGVVFGNGGDVNVYPDGSAKLTIDYLDVRRKATFTSLEIQEKSHVGGEILITPASMVCSRVEELEDAYRCYFETYGESGEEIFNQFADGDQAISQTFNEWGGHYYWRLVTGIGEDYIDLSKTDCAPESDVPKVGDKIIQLGNRTNTTRQAAQVLSSHGDNAPSFIMYNGINSFSLEGKDVTGIEWNAEKQEPQMYSYGSFYFGDRNLEDNFITFQKKEGDEKKSLHINANVTIGADSSGLTNLSEWSEKQAEINKAQSDATAAQQTANVANASVSTLNTRIDAFDETIEEINNKLDGVVESYFDDYTPSRTNEPAATWITDGTEADHVGDTFTNTALQGEDAGKSWRWLEQSDGTYDWQQIADSDAAKALALAGQAKATADGKTTTFLVTPSNYSVGDIWIVGDVTPENFVFKKGDILTTSNSSTEYVANHWSKYLNYMDEFETELNETVGELENSIAQAEEAAKDYSDEGKVALQNAIDELNNAKANITDVYTIAQADGKISDAEQRAIDAADAYAKEAQRLAEETAKAYTDDEVSDAEANAIAEAEAKVNAAKEELDKAIEEVDGRVEETIQRMNDKEELFSTFDKGSNLDVDGVVMSKMVAVKNENDKIEAFLNGSDFAEDTEVDPHTNEPCGKLILAAGIPSDGRDLAERAKEANTRIYEDGCTYTNNLHLQEGCTIGEKIEVTSKGIKMRPKGGVSNTMYIGDDGIEYTGVIELTDSNNGEGFTNEHYTRLGGECSRTIFDIRAGEIVALSCPNPTIEGRQVMTGSYYDVDGFAIYSQRGIYGGFRPMTRVITEDYSQIDKIDHTIIIDANSALNIILPYDPEVGQEYEILMSGIQNTTVQHEISSSANCLINFPTSGALGRESILMNAYGVVKFICGKDKNGIKRWWGYRLA